MTKIVFSLSLAAWIVVTEMPAEAAALRADVPFPFHVGNTMLPPGQYVMRQLSPTILRIENRKAGFSVLVQSKTGIRNDLFPAGRVVFNRYEDQFFLAEAWPGGSSNGNLFNRSEREIRMAARHAAKRIVSTAAR